ncbi:hypothetical protein GEMRC1_001754 [Eukaryota sp. GEM-RC1]
MESSSKEQGKYIALSVLEELVKFKYNVLPVDNANSLKLFLQNLIVTMATSNSPSELLLKKADKVLVEIAKHEWPEKWPTFISDLVSSARSSLGMARNNLTILRLLTEEVTEFSDRSILISARAQALKTQLSREFSSVFDLCLEIVITENVLPDLLSVTLLTLEKFIPWINHTYIFQSNLIDHLVNKQLVHPTIPLSIKKLIVDCLAEIGEFKKVSPHESSLCMTFTNSINALDSSGTMPLDAPIPQAIMHPGEARDFATSCAMMITAFLKQHSYVLESNAESKNAIPKGLAYLLKFSECPPDCELFKACVEYWSRLATDLYSDRQQGAVPRKRGNHFRSYKHRYALYASSLDGARDLIMDRMVKPEEVIIRQDPDTGEWIRETLKDTEEVVLHRTQKDALIFITHLNNEGTKASIERRLRAFMETADQGLDNHSLNRLCWAVGSVSGSMGVDIEKTFVVLVLKRLLDLCNKFRTKDHRAVVASNIMYICSQYPRFLRNSPKFMGTVCNKLFEFMKEEHPGVKEMAVETFLTIAKKCRKKCSELVDNYIKNFHSLTECLPFELKVKVYEALGLMISSFNKAEQQQTRLEAILAQDNAVWRQVLQRGMASGGNDLNSLEVVTRVNEIVRVNTALCTNLEKVFDCQMSVIFKDLLQLFRHYSSALAQCYSTQGETSLRTHDVKAVRLLQKSILTLISTFFEHCPKQDLQQTYFPALLPDLLPSYNAAPPNVRDYEVLDVLTVLNKRVGVAGSHDVFSMVFQPTIGMISENFETFPEIRVSFFKFVSSLVANNISFNDIIKMGEDCLALVIQTAVYASKHPSQDASETGLLTLNTLIKNLSHRNEYVHSFLSKFFIYIFHEVFAILTDTFHKSTFDKQVDVLKSILALLVNSPSSMPVGTDPPQPTGMSNVQYFQMWLSAVITKGYANLSGPQIESFVKSLVELSHDVTKLRSVLADFLVMTRQWTVEEFEYTEEMVEQQLLRSSVPGLTEDFGGDAM